MSKTTANSSESIGYRELIRGNRNFRLLWLGQIISLLGDWFNFVASASLIAILTQSGFAVGSLFVVRMLAPFFISPIAGVVADRYNRKHTLIVTDPNACCSRIRFPLRSERRPCLATLRSHRPPTRYQRLLLPHTQCNFTRYSLITRTRRCQRLRVRDMVGYARRGCCHRRNSVRRVGHLPRLCH